MKKTDPNRHHAQTFFSGTDRPVGKNARTAVIPVMDLRHGMVVQAVRGQRELYRPVESILASGSDPLTIAKALLAETNSPAMYVADLDAILEGRSHWDTLRALSRELSCEFWVDAGISGPDGVSRVLSMGAGQAVVGTECLENMDALAAIGRSAPPDAVLISLDVLDGKTLSKAPGLAGESPLTALGRLVEFGWNRFIVLTLDGVGTGAGPDWELLAAARRMLPRAVLVAGGGVKDNEDMHRASGLGLDGALVATALHRGWITASDLR